jgi:putative flavoprotein involved in K+ transport
MAEGWLFCIHGDIHTLELRTQTATPGIYFLGFPWLHTRKPGIIYGIDEDERHVAEAIVPAPA